MEALNKPWFFPLVFFLTTHAMNTVVTVLMITMTHTTTGTPTVRFGSDQLVGNSVVGNSVVGNSVVGNSVVGNSVVGNSVVGNSVVGNSVDDTTVTDDAMIELIKVQLPPT